MSKEMPKAYEAVEHEDGIYQKWEKEDFFNPDKLKLNADAKSYTISMPPPNVTGTLHMGHASMLAYQDLLIRYHRMKGERTLWVPGTDHAAIATQTKVEKIIKEEGTNRHELGREKFLERVRQFAQESHDTIEKQVKKMGSSCDWSREAYTLDETRTKAVRSVFKMMYEDGLIYRGERIVNWCPRCHSTLADDEVEHKAQKAMLYTFRYSKDFPFAIATTRPETKLGDTAVAVNPKDARYKKYIGKTFAVDFCGVKLNLQVIGDRHVDMEFGTGALGVTPAHSVADWQMAEENDLPIIKVIDEDGKIKEGYGEYSGKFVKDARKMIAERLEKEGLIEKAEEIDNNLSICYRCDMPIEPLPSLQWFIDVNKKIDRLEGKSIKEVSIEAVKSGVFGREKINIIPERFEKTYFHWMDNLKDWCISRQILFGHQVPVWYRQKESRIKNQELSNVETYVGLEAPEDKTNFVFLHGFYRTREILDPLADLAEKLNREDNFWEILPGYDTPDADTQAKFVLDKAKFSEDTIVVTHSLGAILALKLIQENNLKIKKLILLAPAANVKSLVRVPATGFDFDIDFAKIKNNVSEIVVFVPAEDIVVDSKDTEKFAKELGATVIKAEKSASHFNETFNQEVWEYIKKEAWVQDTDTLDTWFSSGLWTFSTLASKPEQISIRDGELHIDTEDFKNFHPTAVLETGYDILFFWVARMIIMTTYAVRDIPFQDVYLHGLVLDDKGKKMSKSKGNVIDPLDMIPKYGTDATRLSLVIGSTPGADMKLSEDKIAGFRNFTNKLWNISRFIIMSDETIKEAKPPIGGLASRDELTIADKWILRKLNILIRDVTNDIDDYKFSQAGERLREFTWNDLADWYLEVNKFEKTIEKGAIMQMILRNILKLWHPFMPFVTEKIWSEFNDSLLIVNPWPESGSYSIDDDEGASFNTIQEIIIAIRNARSENQVEPSKKVKAVIVTKNKALIESQAILIQSLKTGIEEIEIIEKDSEQKDAITIVVGETKVYLLGAIDKDKERVRIQKEIDNLEKFVQMTEGKLNNQGFVDRAPAEVVERERNNLKTKKEELEALRNQLNTL